MELQLRSKRARLSHSLRVYIARRLTFALGQFRSRIRLVKAALEDINGPRGGLDQQCRVMVRLSRGKEIGITGRGADLIAAVDHAADRASHAVGRELGRRQKRVVRLKAWDWGIGRCVPHGRLHHAWSAVRMSVAGRGRPVSPPLGLAN